MGSPDLKSCAKHRRTQTGQSQPDVYRTAGTSGMEDFARHAIHQIPDDPALQKSDIPAFKLSCFQLTDD